MSNSNCLKIFNLQKATLAVLNSQYDFRTLPHLKVVILQNKCEWLWSVRRNDWVVSDTAHGQGPLCSLTDLCVETKASAIAVILAHSDQIAIWKKPIRR